MHLLKAENWSLQLCFFPVQAISKKAKVNRSKHVLRHTSGSKSHAEIQYEQVADLI